MQLVFDLNGEYAA